MQARTLKSPLDDVVVAAPEGHDAFDRGTIQEDVVNDLRTLSQLTLGRACAHLAVLFITT